MTNNVMINGPCKNAVALERVGEGRTMLEQMKRKKFPGPLAKMELPAEGCSRRNGKWEEGSRLKKSDDQQRLDKWTV